MALAAAGAAGRTAGQLSQGLHLTAGEAPAVPAVGADNRLDVANSLWVARGLPLRLAFADRARAAFAAAAEPADFAAHPDAARLAVNAWVADHTQRKILDLLPEGSVTRQTRLVLADAVYFQGQWATPFAGRATAPAPFHLAADRSVDVPMMHLHRQRLPVLQGPTFDAVALPYAGDAVAMLVVVPHAVDGLPAVEQSLTGEVLAGWDVGVAVDRG